MKLLLRTLVSNVHLLLVSLILVTFGLASAFNPTSVNESPSEVQKAHSPPDAPAGPTVPTSNQISINASSTPKSPLQGSYEGQGQPEPSISTLSSYIPPTPTSVDTLAPAPSPPLPAPSPEPEPTPLPPSSPCGNCGIYNSSRPQHLVCPMYCVYSAK